MSVGGAPQKYWLGMGSNEFLRVCSMRYASAILREAIRWRVVVRQPCVVCEARAVGHHWDYSKPLDVIWLCQRHHMDEHKRLGNTGVMVTGCLGISSELRAIIAKRLR